MGVFISTRGRTRTGTAIQPTDFKSVVSTNSTTRAKIQFIYLEASIGFEPMNDSFANCSLGPLGYDAIIKFINEKKPANLMCFFKQI